MENELHITIISTFLSNHKAQIIDLTAVHISNEKKYTSIRPVTNFGIFHLRQKLDAFNWSHVLNNQDIDMVCTVFVYSISSAVIEVFSINGKIKWFNRHLADIRDIVQFFNELNYNNPTLNLEIKL